MKRGILAALFITAILYVPQRANNGEVNYAWAFRMTERLDLPLLVLELVILGIVTAIVITFDRGAADKKSN